MQQQSNAPMQLNQHSASYKYPKLRMGEDTSKCHILPGEHLQGKIVDVEHITFPAQANKAAERSTVVSFIVDYAQINKALITGQAYCVVIGKKMREAFLTAQYGINDHFGILYQGRLPVKSNPMYSYHAYTIEGLKTSESQVVPDVEPLAAAPAPAATGAPMPNAPAPAPQAPQTPAPAQAPAPQMPATQAPQAPAAAAPLTPAPQGQPVVPQTSAAPQVPAGQQHNPAVPNMPQF